MITLALFACLMLVRFWVRKRWSVRDRLLYMGVAFVGLFFLAITGFFGGDLVYRYGAGVQRSTPAETSLPTSWTDRIGNQEKMGGGDRGIRKTGAQPRG